jgi:hypothetical protein
MGRVYISTHRSQMIGVRQTGEPPTLGAAIPFPRSPGDAFPRPTNNPTGRMLGGWLGDACCDGGNNGGALYPVDYPPAYALPISPVIAFPGAPPVSTPAAPAVSASPGPTPTVTVPPPDAISQPMLISSGGGSPISMTPPAAAAPTTPDFWTSVTTWFQGSTLLFGYQVPNVALAGAAGLALVLLRRKR